MDIQAYSFDAKMTDGVIALCDRLYAGDPGWNPARSLAIRAAFAPEHRFYRQLGHRHRHFTARRNGDVVGHVSAFVHPGMIDPEGRRIGGLGLFECEEDGSVADLLLESALGWLRQQDGVQRIWGPVNFDLWGGYRLKCRGFEHGTFFGEPCNQPYYASLFESAGFEVGRSWSSTDLDRRELERIVASSGGRYRRAMSAGYRFRRFDEADPADLRVLHELVSRSYCRFPGYTPIDLAEFGRVFGSSLQAMDSRFITLVHDPAGSVVGFHIVFPDPAQAGCHPARLVCHTMGVTPEEVRKRRGLGGALACHTALAALDAGLDSVLAALVAQDSPVRGFVGMGSGDAEYVLYEIEP